MRLLSNLPIFVVTVIVAALAMLIPAGYAFVIGASEIGRNFLHSSALILIVSGMVALASVSAKPSRNGRTSLLTIFGFFGVLPIVLAIPFAESLPDTGLFNAWWEMVSSLTTTGATLYSADLLAAPLHLWRGIVGWLGGFFMLAAAISLLAPLRIGGFEILSSPYGRSEHFDKLPKSSDPRESQSHLSAPGFQTELQDPMNRLTRAVIAVFPIYAGMTLLLWIILLSLGDAPLLAFMRAMGTLATSGISPVVGPAGYQTGVIGEMAVFVFLIPALSRRFWPGGGALRASANWQTDPELRLAFAVIVLIVALLFLRHFFADPDDAAFAEMLDEQGRFSMVMRAIWGDLFSALSYLTTTGWTTLAWENAWSWAGLSEPGLLLAGLAIMGGGVATTAGGVKLLRVYALMRHGERELSRSIHPSSVAGGGRMARRLRREGAYLAFIFFMLFAVSISVMVVLVSIEQLEFETAMILSISSLTNTGPLASVIPLTPAFDASAGSASAPWIGWSGLPVFTKTILAGGMIVGRLETLAILALFMPDFWRR